MPTSSISNVTKDLNGNVVPLVPVVITLQPPGGFRISDSSEVAPEYSTTSDAGGSWAVALEQTSNISPTGSYYVAQEQYPASAGGYREYAFTVGVGNATLFASLLATNPPSPTTNYLTQAQGDARYALLSTGSSNLRVVNVLDYGATGDGLTDDYAAIQAAINATPTRGVLFFPETSPAAPTGATYLCNTSPTWKDFIRVTGGNWQGSIIKMASGVSGINLTNCDFTTFENLRIDSAGGTATGLVLNATTYATLRNMFFRLFSDLCVGSNVSFSCIFDNCRFTAGTNGIFLNHCNDMMFRSLEVQCTGTYIDLTRTQAVTLEDWRGSQGAPFLVLHQGTDACRDTTLIGCDIEDSSTSPFITATDASIYNLTIIGCNIASASGSPAARAIEFGGKGLTVIGNTFTSFSSNPVLLDANADGGIIASNTSAGVSLNVVTDNSTAHTITYLNETISRLGRAVVLPAGTTAAASIRLPHGAAPTSPVDGDMWTTSAGGLFVRINGVTVGPLS